MHRFHMPTDVRCGAGSLKALGAWKAWGKRPVILCGRQSARAHGHLDAVLHYMPDAIVLDGFPENPRFSDCEDYGKRCRAGNVDVIVALGGGSVIDGAKALALLARHGGTCSDYLDPEHGKDALPIIAIPTTGGTGSEVTPYAVLVDDARNRKSTLKSPQLFPRLALLDPTLTTTLPREVTVATALDALSQVMEGMLSTQSTPTGDILALDACRRIRHWLPVALEQPTQLEAREQLLYAAMLSGVVIAQSGTTLVHGMGYYYTLEHGIAHGAANALLLPPLFWWNAQHAPEKVPRLAEALGHGSRPAPSEAGYALTESLYHFYRLAHFKYAARDHGVPQEACTTMAAQIIAEPGRFKNQPGTLTESQVRALYQAAWAGAVEDLPREFARGSG